MGLVKCINFYVGPDLGRPFKAPEGLRVDDGGKMSQMFRDAILKGKFPFTVQLRVLHYPEVVCNFAVGGTTAGIATWWRHNQVQALTGFFSGLDAEDEEQIELAFAHKPYPITLHDWHSLDKHEPPFFSTFLLTRESAEDRVIETAAPVLANSFFSTLGIECEDFPTG